MSGKHLPPHWKGHFLGGIGGKATVENLRFLYAWQVAEGGDADWNPLNSTLKLPGSTDYNSAGVQNYPRALHGIAATILTITGPPHGALYYPGLLGALQSGGDLAAEEIVNQHSAEIEKWGTNPATILKILEDTPR